MNHLKTILCIAFLGPAALPSPAREKLSLSSDSVRIEWEKGNDGWRMSFFGSLSGKAYTQFGEISGEYSLLYDSEKPPREPVPITENGLVMDFPEETFKYVKPDFERATWPVAMNTAGDYVTFYPDRAWQQDEAVVFGMQTPYGQYTARWVMDEQYPSDVVVSLSFTATREGYYSLPTPTLGVLREQDLLWVVVPGYFQGHSLQDRFPLAYAYAQGLPRYPVVCRESTLTTMASVMTAENGLTLAVIPSPGQDRNPYENDSITHVNSWKIALSHMNRHGELSPTAYHPVLGEEGSYLEAGQSVAFEFRITLRQSDWYEVYKHVVYDIYNLSDYFNLQRNEMSLSDRLMKMYDYVLDDHTALWHEERYRGRTIMAQEYNSDVVGSDNDAMKNSDIGAVWMLARLTGNPLLNENRLPYIRNFKIEQQVRRGFFKGAVEGQYFLSESKRFTEEWGNHFEPVAVTYYSMSDLGNILLFEPDNGEIRKLLRNSTDRLLEWQKPDGSWKVAYDRTTCEPVFSDLTDFRPTFYGLLVAWQLFGDAKYLDGAVRGAEWIVENSVAKGHFLGVCGDVRFVNDFATMQTASALLDMYEATGKQKYLDAAVATARIYTTSIYTHPIPTRHLKTLKGRQIEDWRLSQVGLGFEHGGAMGSAVNSGPILLTSHCGTFLRFHRLTGDPLFRDLARLGALGKDAFVDKATGVVSYYWARFDNGAGPFPHHAWWQIGWIYDYLLAEAELRSEGEVKFDRGFMTAKVGPHKSAGFKPGTISGKQAKLILRKGLVTTDNPDVEYLTALDTDEETLFVILLNDRNTGSQANLAVDLSAVWDGFDRRAQTLSVTVSPFGIKIIEFKR